MTTIPIPDEAVEALSEGKTVKITHEYLGDPGRNGSLLLSPTSQMSWSVDPSVEVKE